MLSWFRRKRPELEVSRRLAQLEDRAARASSGYETQHLLQAGDLCTRVGRNERALTYYGQALDCYLETGRLAAAEALCRRMLSVAPHTVRVRGTRMWLVAARGALHELRAAVAEYVHAGAAAGQEDLIALQLGLLAEAGTLEVREVVAEALLEFGAEAEADRFCEAVVAERNGLAPSAIPLMDHEWGERMLEATLLRPDQARQQRLRAVA